MTDTIPEIMDFVNERYVFEYLNKLKHIGHLYNCGCCNEKSQPCAQCIDHFKTLYPEEVLELVTSYFNEYMKGHNRDIQKMTIATQQEELSRLEKQMLDIRNGLTTEKIEQMSEQQLTEFEIAFSFICEGMDRLVKIFKEETTK